MNRKKIPEVWGFSQLIVTAAHRYCLGRRTYFVGVCIEWLITYWQHFEIQTQRLVLKETERALREEEAGGASEVEEWERFLRTVKCDNE